MYDMSCFHLCQQIHQTGPLQPSDVHSWIHPVLKVLFSNRQANTTEETLLMLIGGLAREGLTHQTVKVYLLAICNLCVSAGLNEELSKNQFQSWNRFHDVLRKKQHKDSNNHY